MSEFTILLVCSIQLFSQRCLYKINGKYEIIFRMKMEMKKKTFKQEKNNDEMEHIIHNNGRVVLPLL